MRYYLAPLEGITGYIFRNAHTRLFTPADKYFSPFLVPKPNSGKQFSAKEKADILPEHNQNIHLVPQIMTNKAADFIAMTKALDMVPDLVNRFVGGKDISPEAMEKAEDMKAGYEAEAKEEK